MPDCLTETNLYALKEQIAAGDELAFRQLYNGFALRLHFFALAMVRTRDGATEVVDEVFIRLWKQRQNMDRIQNLKIYLYTAVKNAALNFLAQKAAQMPTQPFDYFHIQLQAEGNPEKQLISSELMKKIAAAIEALPPRCKMIFKLVREDGLKYKEVAEILNISPKTVDAQMVIAVRQISEKVKSDFDRFPKRETKEN